MTVYTKLMRLWLGASMAFSMIESGALAEGGHTGAEPPATSGYVAHPDFTGVWDHARIPGEGEYLDGQDTRDLSFMKPWVLAEVRRREKAQFSGHPIPNAGVLCLPEGMPNVLTSGHSLQIIQTPKEVMLLAESDHQIVPVYMNSRHPANLLPSWYGHSIGHWEGDTLVIDTVGVSDKTLIDSTGTPHSLALHITTRMRLQGGGRRIEAVFTLDDPLAFYRPWTYTRHYDKSDDSAVGEYACAENNDHYVQN